MMEEKELIAYAIERIKSLLPGLLSRPVPPLPKHVKVNLSRVIGVLIKHVESVLAGSTEPWTTDMVWNAGVIPSSPSELDSATRRGEETTVSDALLPDSTAEVCCSTRTHTQWCRDSLLDIRMYLGTPWRWPHPFLTFGAGLSHLKTRGF